MGLVVKEIEKSDRPALEAYVRSRADTTFVDTWAWREVLEKVYGLPHYWYLARNNGVVEGFLGLTLTKHALFGPYLATAPFANHGGFYADSAAALEGLLEKAGELRSRLRARYINIRSLQTQTTAPPGWHPSGQYATYWLSLDSNQDALLSDRRRAKAKRAVRRAEKWCFECEFGGIHLLEDFWWVMSHSMKELGSPYHSIVYLETILKMFGDRTRIAVVYSRLRQPVAASLLMYHNDTVTQLHANTMQEYRTEGSGDFLYWSVISHSIQTSVKRLDMGRSLMGSGNEVFKMKWGPQKSPLAYWYNLSAGQALPQLNQANPRLQLAIKTWQRLPLWFHRVAGPRLISGVL